MTVTLSLLFVDDYAPIRHSLRVQFPAVVNPIVEASSLKEARELVDKHGPFTFAVVDVHLPDGSGLDLVPELQQAGTEVYIFTGDGDPDLINRVADSDAAMIHKGGELLVLFKRLARHPKVATLDVVRRQSRAKRLTPRQQEYHYHRTLGLARNEAALVMKVSTHTTRRFEQEIADRWGDQQGYAELLEDTRHDVETARTSTEFAAQPLSSVLPSHDEWIAWTNDALRHMYDPTWLAQSPLLHMPFLAPNRRPEELRENLCRACADIVDHTEEEVLKTVLGMTYLSAGRKQAAVASMLGMSRSTFRRYLKHAVRQLAAQLRARCAAELRPPTD